MTDQERKNEVAANIRKARGERSQAEFARLIDATQAQVSEWESGKCEPKMKTVIKICRVSGVDISTFVKALDKAGRKGRGK